MQNRSGRLILNSIYSLLGWFLPVTLGLLVTPFLLKRLGVEAYGVYLVILGFIGYSFTFSVSKAVAKYVSEFKATGETGKINAVISAAFGVSLVAGIIGFLLTAVLAEWAVKDLLQISTNFQRTATIALMIGGATIPLILLGQVFQYVLQGSHRFGPLSIITNLNWFLLNAGNVLLVVYGFGIDALLMWTVAVAGIIAAVSYAAARRAEPAYGLSLVSAGAMLRPVAAYGSSIFLYQIFGSLIHLFERAWITRHYGADVAAYYLVPMVLATHFHGFASNLTAATFPALNDLLSDRPRLLELYKKSTKLLVALTVLFLLSIYFGGKSFLTIWIDPEFAENSYRMLWIHASTFGLIAVVIGMWQINEVFHAPRINSLLAAMWAVITVVLIVSMSSGWGPEGVAASRLIGVAVTMPVILLVEKRFLGGVQWRFWGVLSIRILAAAIALTLVEYSVFSWTDLEGWVELILAWVCGTLTYFLVLGSTGFVTKDEKAAILSLFGFYKAQLK